MKKMSHLTQAKTESKANSNRAKESVNKKTKMEYGQSNFQDLETFLRTIRIKVGGIYFTQEKYISNFETYEVPSFIYKVSCN